MTIRFESRNDATPRRDGWIGEPRHAVLAVDGDIGFLLVLATELDHREINLLPSGSVEQARDLVATLKLKVDVLIINCRLSGACDLAMEMIRNNTKLEVIGIVSAHHQCSSCSQLLTLVSEDSDAREALRVRRWCSLVQSRLGAKHKLAVISDHGSEARTRRRRLSARGPASRPACALLSWRGSPQVERILAGAAEAAHYGSGEGILRGMEYFFACPHCWEQISMVLDTSVKDQIYVEDCEVCCHPIEVRYKVKDNAVCEFEARTVE